MRRTGFLILLVLLLAAPSLCAASFGTPLDGSASVEFLNDHYSESPVEQKDSYFWDRSDISLMTVGPGKILYEWFGHSAVVVSWPGYDSINFNYGYFSFNEKYFQNFAMGRLLYRLDASYTDMEVFNYRSKGRDISQVVLNLSAEKKKAVSDFLRTNATPPEDTYLYHYYEDNCATRVRDLINFVTDGDFETWARGIKGHTFRQWNSVVFGANPWVQWVMDFLQSRAIDNKDASLWSEMYLPDRLLYAVQQYPGLETKETHGSAEQLHSIYEYKPKSVLLPALGLSVLFSAVLFACAFFYSGSNGRKWAGHIFNALSFTVYLVFGLLGALLLFMMLFTTHDVTWGNENALLYSPLLLVAAVLSLNTVRHRRALLKLWYAEGCALVLLVLLKLILSGTFYQQNWAQILPLVPVVGVNIAVLRLYFREDLTERS